MSAIHRLVLADMERSRTRAEYEVERLRSDREGISTVGTTGQARALRVGKLLREAEAIAQGWRIAVAAVLAERDELDANRELLLKAAADAGPVVKDAALVGYVADRVYGFPLYRCLQHPFDFTKNKPLSRVDVPAGAKCGNSGCGASL